MTHDFTEYKGIQRVKGKQFRYILPLTRGAKKLLNESTVTWNKDYPKEDSLKWKIRTGIKQYKDLKCIPTFNLEVVNINKQNVEGHK